MILRMRLGIFSSRIVLVPLLLAVTACAVAILAQRQVACGTNAQRETLHVMLNGMLRSDDSSARKIRDQLHVSQVHHDSVRYIADYGICHRASARYYRDVIGLRTIRTVSVARVRDRYIVYGDKRGGEWTVVEVYDLAFRLIARTAF
jgi:hypothetical protein